MPFHLIKCSFSNVHTSNRPATLVEHKITINDREKVYFEEKICMIKENTFPLLKKYVFCQILSVKKSVFCQILSVKKCILPNSKRKKSGVAGLDVFCHSQLIGTVRVLRCCL